MNRSDVFLSYRRKDKEFTQKLDQAFKAEGLEVWVDWEDIPPGSTDFTEDIKDGIDGADVFVAVLSPSYIESPYCMGELDMAIENHKRIVPIVLHKFDELFDKIPSAITHINWVYFTPHVGDANEFDDAFPILMEAIRADHEHAATHTRYLLRAREWDEDNRNASRLLVGSEIDAAEMWLATAADKNPRPVSLHSEYIFASRARQRAQQRRLLIGVSIAFVVSIALAIVSVFLYRDAREQEQIAQNQTLIAEEQRKAAERNQAESQSLLWATYAQDAVRRNDNLLALPIALEANNITEDLPVPPALSQQALASAAYAPGARSIYDLEGQRGWVAQFSPDETHIAAGSANGVITIWERGNPAEPVMTLEGHTGSVWDLAYDPEEPILVSTGADGNIIVWDTETGEEVDRLEGHNGSSQWSLAFDERGRYLASGGVDGNVYVWNFRRRELEQTLDGGNHQVWAVEFSPNNIYLAAAGNDGRIQAWDGRDFSLVRTYETNENNIWSLAFNDTSERLIAGGDRLIRMWDMNSGAVMNNRYSGHLDRVLALEFTPSGDRFISASADNSIIFWDVNRAVEVVRYEGHEDNVWSLDVSHRVHQFISAAADGQVILWDIEGGSHLDIITTGHSGDILALDVSRDREFVITSDDERNIQVRALSGSGIIELAGHTQEVNDVKFSPDGTTALSAGDTRVLMWDLNTASLKRIFNGHGDKVQAVDYHPTEQLAISGSSDNKVILWNLSTADALYRFEGHGATVTDVAFSPDGTKFASAGADRKVIIWDLETREEIARFTEHTDVVRAIAFSPDGTTVASAGNDQLIILTNIETGEFQRFTGHAAAINDVNFNPDGTLLVSGSEDRLVIMWDMNGNQLRRYEEHTDGVTATVFDNTEQHNIFSAGRDGNIIIWRADSLEQLVKWTRENRGIRELTCLERELYQLNPDPSCETAAEDVIAVSTEPDSTTNTVETPATDAQPAS